MKLHAPFRASTRPASFLAVSLPTTLPARLLVSLLAPLVLAGLAAAQQPTDAPARLAQAKKQLAALSPQALNARLAVVEWLLEGGLANEAELELERVLRTDPGHARALELAARRATQVDVESWIEPHVSRSDPAAVRAALLRLGARECAPAGRAIVREAIVTRLVGDGSRASNASDPASAATIVGTREHGLDADLARALLAELESGTTTRRVFACHVLRRAVERDAREREAALERVQRNERPARALDGATGATGDVRATKNASDTTHAPIVPASRDGDAAAATTPDAAGARALDVVGPLAVRCVLDPASEVRDAAAVALRDARDVRACSAVVRALANPHGNVRVHAIEALGRMEYPQAIDPLVQLMWMASAPPPSSSGGGPVRSNLYVGLHTAYVQDFDVEIAQGSAIADPIVNVLTSGVVFDVGVGGVSTVSVTAETWTAARSLARLTGQRLGADASAWKKWWDENRARFVPGARRADRD